MKHLRHLPIYALLLLIIFSCSSDEDPMPQEPQIVQDDIPEIDSKMAFLMDEFNYPGLSLAIAKDGKLVYAKGYGLMDQGSNRSVNTETKFRYSSVAKTITGIAILQLVEEGKLALNDRVFGDGAILGTRFGSNTYSHRIRNITVNHLLHHLPGGWRNFMDDPVFDGPINLSAEDLISWGLDNVVQATNPGTTYHYSNFGYLILGRIIEQVTGKSYETYVKENILDKVGATNTVLARTAQNQKHLNEATYYSQNNFNPYTTYNIGRSDATAGWVSTPADIAMIFSSIDTQPNRPSILGTTLNDQRRTPLSNSGNYGKGIIRLNHPTLGQAFWHDGFWVGSQSLTISLPNNICVSVVMNSGYAENYNLSLNTIAGQIFEIMASTTITYQDIDQF
ncbi:serine hydrolase domain-containing protein [Mongoliitalea daihaiensis]|uniref:serine hydrolase domain-containing protein n=1 Tax=Mongoliitalea daihaiensis TaxID=2782006 RepID=UPI001F38DD7D|nr:serine hydrolase domain-containing protein [Mongoliitalea daihaiensis]UJP65914.1 beta-lactamase family protein [Mongoliitalea daihaiensis]